MKCAIALFVDLVLSLMLVHVAQAQQSDSSEADPSARLREARDRVPILLRLFLPDGLREGYILREYLASDDFVSDEAGRSDTEKFDDIYDCAVELAHGETTKTFLATAFSVFEHRSIPIQIFGGVVSIPLTTESAEHYQKRVDHLPIHVYGAENDRDKSQHFFASAWLKRVFGISWFANVLGELVEIGEESFVLGGSNDPRDKHANHDGVECASNYDDCVFQLPSNYLTPNPTLPVRTETTR
ncbi:MAG: hypothetical protein ABI444_13910 [Candidatus Kapaibacterium sp.]|jgi:hypothetical protein